MSKMNNININLFLIPLFCFNCSDYFLDLGKGYTYRNEGGPLKDIFHKTNEGGEIPPTILTYNYNSKYIIAKQIPKLPFEAIRKQYKYEFGYSEVYYWIIDKDKCKCYGPMNIKQYTILREKLEIPSSLNFEEK